MPEPTLMYQFEKFSSTEFRLALPPNASDSCILLVTCSAKDYPLANHFCYMQHRDASAPYTYSNMDFSSNEGGIRVGPWCGWRGIPPMPRMSLRIGARELHGRFDFWGDEEATGLLRCTFECEQIDTSEIVLTVGDERIVPSNARVYPMEMHRAQPMEISLSPMHLGKHPRLLFSEVDLPSLSGKAISTHASFWKRIIQLFDQWELPFEKTPESKLPGGPERLSPEDRLLLSSLRALIEPNVGAIAQARAELVGYLALTTQDDFEPLNRSAHFPIDNTSSLLPTRFHSSE